MYVTAIIQRLKESEQDFEWYPTTPEMLEAIRADMWSVFCPYNAKDDKLTCSVLDVGAGNGSALKALTQGKKYAIEKSKILLSTLDKDIFVVGTDFTQQTLIDKKVDVVLSNPPYCQQRLKIDPLFHLCNG